jgi:hypothetical protein
MSLHQGDVVPSPSDPGLSPRRALENEQFLESINERLKASLLEVRDEAGEDPDAHFRFFCECSDLSCRERMHVRPSRLTAIHEDPDQFILLPGHEVPAVERVVDQEEDYLIVRKIV